MEIFKNPSFDFMSKRKLSYIISTIVILIGLMSMVINGGFLLHIDFTGGLALEIETMSHNGNYLSVNQLRDALNRNGITDVQIQELATPGSFLMRSRILDFGTEGFVPPVVQPVVQPVAVEETEYAEDGENYYEATEVNEIVVPAGNVPVYVPDNVRSSGERIVTIVRAEFPEFAGEENIIRQLDEVGARAGADLSRKAINAILISLLAMLIYIWIRFRFTWGFACAFGLFHDTMIALAVISLMGIEIGMTVLAALLTIIGYSINNTIVIFDRIRENLKLYRKEDDMQIINRSINETLNRNVVLSFTTLLTILSLITFGGPVIFDFAFTLMIGIIAGTFSSMWIVTGIVMDIVLAIKRRGSTKLQVSSFKK